MERLQYHFEPQKGWINDPNGLIFYKGRYHAFFQYNPNALQWDTMHWGHAVSDDLIHWTELDIALYPDREYENAGGCFSGSAVEKDGRLYLFYTSVSKELGQTQSIAVSDDGLHFEKYSANPIIRRYPEEGSADFRDPKVCRIQDTYYMVCGSGKDGIGKILLYQSDNLYDWHYQGVLFQDEQCGKVLECPDFFELDGKYVLMFSMMNRRFYSTQFVIGTFDGHSFQEEARSKPEAGPQFYAPQTFRDNTGRRIMIGWLYNWGKPLDTGADCAGALTIPRQLTRCGQHILNFPVVEAKPLLTDRDNAVEILDRRVRIDQSLTLDYDFDLDDIAILRDTKTIEIFLNQGRKSISYWFTK